MGAHTLLCRSAALRGRDDHLAHHVQAAGPVERRHHPLHLLALPAVGHQAPVEPLRRPHQDQALVDYRHAAAHRRSTGRRGLHHSGTVLAHRLAMLLLAHGLLQRHPRHSSRRLLHARTGQPRTGLLRGHTLHVLPHSHHLRTGTARHAGRQPGGHHAQRALLLEPHVLYDGRTLHRLLAVAPLHPAQALGGPPHGRSDRRRDMARLRPHVHHLLPEATGRRRHLLHALLPHARRTAGQGQRPLPHRLAGQRRTRALAG